MKLIPITIHLIVHRISFHVKFPASLSLQLQIDKSNKTIASDISLGKQIITINRQFQQEAILSYDELTKSFEDKKISIIILLKTKTSPNKLTAGIVSLDLCKPSQRVSSIIAKPLRCNDSRAFIEYSLRTEISHKSRANHQSRINQEANNHFGKSSEGKGVFKSAVHYINNQMQEVKSQNQLLKYLYGYNMGAQRNDSRRHKSSNKLPTKSAQNCEEDESKTEIMSIRKQKRKSKQHSIISNQENFYQKKFKELSKKSEIISKQGYQAKLQNQNLLSQNRQLKTKLKRYQGQLDQQSTLIKNINKKWELKQITLSDEIKQIKNKLHQSQSQLHELLFQRNKILNEKQARQKQMIVNSKEKERILNQQNKKKLVELGLKSLQFQSMKNERDELLQSVNSYDKIMKNYTAQNEVHNRKYAQLLQKYEQLQKEILFNKTAVESLTQDSTNKSKQIDDLKNHKKVVYELKQAILDKQIILKQNLLTISELQENLKQKQTTIKKKNNSVEKLSKQIQDLKIKLKQQNNLSSQLNHKIDEYDKQKQKSVQIQLKLSNKLKDVQLQLNNIKKHANTSIGQKSKLMIQYENFITALKEKIESVTNQRTQIQQKYDTLNKLYRQKQDQSYDLGQQLIQAKEQLLNSTNQIQTLRQQNNYLGKSLKELSQKQQKLMILQEKLQYNERFYEESEQRYELQKIELENQIRFLQQKNNQKGQVLSQYSERLRKAQKELLEHQDQIESLKMSLNTKTNELNYLKIQSDRQRNNNIKFEQRMAILRRVQEKSTASLQDLQQQNMNLKIMIKQNTQAITNLGKRYESLYKSTLQSFNQLLQLIKSDKRIINFNIKHQKQQISSLLNDFIRYVATQRENNSLEIARINRLLQSQINTNKQNIKLIKIKTQIQIELEQQLRQLKLHTSTLESQIARLQNDIRQKQKENKEKQVQIFDLKKDNDKQSKQNKAQLNKKDKFIRGLQDQKQKLNKQIGIQIQKCNQNTAQFNLRISKLQAQFNQEIDQLNSTISQLSKDLSNQKSQSKSLRIKITDLQSTLAKATKQKQLLLVDLDKRTKQLIQARTQSQERYKRITSLQEQVQNQIKVNLKQSKQKEALVLKNQNILDINKELSAKKRENQTLIKNKVIEINQLKAKIEQVENANKQLQIQYQDLTKNKETQQKQNSNFSQTIKSLKDANLKNDQLIKKMSSDKQISQLQWNKKLFMVTNQKQTLQKQFNDFKTKAISKQTQLSSKQKSLTNELATSKQKIKEYTSTIGQLKKQIELSNDKINSITGEFNLKSAQFQTKQKSLLPNAGKIKQIIQSITELRSIGKDYQTSKNKLLRLTNQSDRNSQYYDYIFQVVRELNISINRLKIQILNKLNISKEIKTVLLDGLKNLQILIEKINNNS